MKKKKRKNNIFIYFNDYCSRSSRRIRMCVVPARHDSAFRRSARSRIRTNARAKVSLKFLSLPPSRPHPARVRRKDRPTIGRGGEEKSGENFIKPLAALHRRFHVLRLLLPTPSLPSPPLSRPVKLERARILVTLSSFVSKIPSDLLPR